MDNVCHIGYIHDCRIAINSAEVSSMSNATMMNTKIGRRELRNQQTYDRQPIIEMQGRI